MITEAQKTSGPIRILHIETATKVCSVAISEDAHLLAVTESKDDEFVHGEKLTLYIEDVMRQTGRTLSELHAISVSAGPGSYTGLRIGAATAKGLSYALGIPLIAIDSLLCLAALTGEHYSGVNRCALLDARRMEVYNMIYDSNLAVLKEMSADIVDETSYSEFEPFIYFGDGALKASEIWKGRNCQFVPEIDSSARGQVSLAFQKYNAGDFVDTAYWEPLYLKDFIPGIKK